MKNRKFHLLLLAIALIVCQLCGSAARATDGEVAVDNSKSFTLTVLANNGAEANVKAGDVVTVELYITQDGATDTFSLPTVEDTISWDPELLEFVTPDTDVNGDGYVDAEDGLNLTDEPGGIHKIIDSVNIDGVEDGEIYFMTNIYAEVFNNLPTVNKDLRLVSFKLKAIKNGEAAISHYQPEVQKSSGTIYALTAVPATVTIASGQLQQQQTLTVRAAKTSMTEGDVLDLTAEGGSGSGSVSYKITSGAECATISGSKLTAKKAGTVTVVATKAADGTYAKAESESITITINAKQSTPSTPSSPSSPSSPSTGSPGTGTTKQEQPVVVAPQPLTQFGDVAAGAYYEDAVAWAVGQKITTGVSSTKFDPLAACNRGQLVTFLWRASGSPEPSAAAPFADVGEGTYYAKAVAWAYENGITTGAVGGGFNPTDTVTRAQVVMMLYRLAGSPAADGSAFTDVPAEKYYASAVAWAVQNEITTGVSASRFDPNADCDRAQIVTFLFRDLGKK